MKVLHVIPTLRSGGAEKMLYDMLKGMALKGIECEVAVLTKTNNFYGAAIEELNIPLHYSESPKIYSVKNIFFLKDLFKKGNYDCIHAHLYGAQLFTPMAMKLFKTNVPVLTTEHSTHNRRRDYKSFYILDNWMYKQYVRIVAISKDTRKHLINYLPNTKNKIDVIENGIDINAYALERAIDRKKIHADLTDDEKIVLMVAVMRDQKDHETLIRASKLLPLDYRVVFVGDGERFDEIRKYAQVYGRENIVFTGKRTDVPAIMKASDIFVLSSKWEGFGLVVVEAAATGLPVVASNVDGLNEVVHKVGGSVFEPFNEQDLVEKIMFSVEKGYINCDFSYYSIEKTVEQYLALYKKMIR